MEYGKTISQVMDGQKAPKAPKAEPETGMEASNHQMLADHHQAMHDLSKETAQEHLKLHQHHKKMVKSLKPM